MLLNISCENSLFQKLCGTRQCTVWLKAEFYTNEFGGTIQLSPGFNPNA